MTFKQIDHIADLVNPLFAVLIIILAIAIQKKTAHIFILRTAVSLIIVQQIAKAFQKAEIVSDNFPSTHYAFALSLAVSYLFLNRKLWPLSAILAFGYGGLMLYAHANFMEKGVPVYHTPVELAGAIYAIPLTILFHVIGRKKAQPVASN